MENLSPYMPQMKDGKMARFVVRVGSPLISWAG